MKTPKSRKSFVYFHYTLVILIWLDHLSYYQLFIFKSFYTKRLPYIHNFMTTAILGNHSLKKLCVFICYHISVACKFLENFIHKYFDAFSSNFDTSISYIRVSYFMILWALVILIWLDHLSYYQLFIFKSFYTKRLPYIHNFMTTAILGNHSLKKLCVFICYHISVACKFLENFIHKYFDAFSSNFDTSISYIRVSYFIFFSWFFKILFLLIYFLFIPILYFTCF